MRIQIIKTSDFILWYSTLIGEVFDVVRIDSTVFWVKEKTPPWYCLNWVSKEDCKVLND